MLDSCQLLLEDILGANIDHFALKGCTLKEPEVEYQVLLLALLGLIGCIIESIASVLVWQHLNKSGIGVVYSLPISLTRISLYSSRMNCSPHLGRRALLSCVSSLLLH